ncbi:hypothetical protein [Litorimonas haliclonae]|uniref:hypothetical protein n=1 Tax=Litorimonas haliclonae TaxID=2081977 RepID=UPI0039EE4EB6
MPIKSIMGAVSVLGLLSLSGVANAGNCAGPDCRLGVSYIPGPPAQFGPVTVQNNRPMGYLRSVNFQRAPHISIMRVHSLEAGPGLSDAPVAFTGGCHPESTQYCRQDAGVPVNVELFAPAPPPAYTGQVSIPTTYSSQTVDHSLFQSRQYGDAGFVPGIAHIPTSRVDRSPENADRVLNSGRTIPQPHVSGGVAPRPSMTRQNREYTGQVSIPTTYGARSSGFMGGVQAPAPAYLQQVGIPETYAFGASQLAGAPVLQSNGTYGSTVGADGTYWEKTSGPTFFGDTLATQVICKRKVETQVVNPVVGVPVPTCQTSQPHAPHQGHVPAQPQYPGWTY